jgi:Winged helix domain, variant/ATPase family associated with various cellular activities (AAA)
MTDSLAYLLARLDLLRTRVRLLVEHRAAGDPTAGDPLRGLYVSPEDALRIAGSPSPVAGRDTGHDTSLGELEAVAEGSRLHRLAASCGLTALDAEILLIALAPEVDRSFEQLYGYLNDDVSRRRATAGLALDLCGHPAWSVAGRGRLAARAPLVAGSLLAFEDADRPFPGRGLRVPDRVTAYLLGDDEPDGELAGALAADDVHDGPPAGGEFQRLAQRLRREPLLVYLREARPGAGTAVACSVLRAADRPVLRVDPARLAESAVPALLREARLRGAGVVAGPLPDGARIRQFTGVGVPVLLTGPEPFDPAWADRQPLVLEVGAQRAAGAWRAELPEDLGFDLAAATGAYHFDAAQVRHATSAAREYAALEDVPLTAAHLHRGARLQNAAGLEKHARRIRPAVGWDDLVLPPEPRGQLRELVARARHRDRVLGEWRLRRGGGRGRGVVAMFAGESGTGKTMAGEVVAAELGLDLYVVELSAVVDKYIGETEKNLDRIFTEAGRLDAVLLFDEADAVFGKRSEVKDSHDRYANLESAFLLQRLESFDGIAVLTTNLRANIDDAFTRRLDLVIDFPFPDETQRRTLWERCLAPPVPCGDDLDLDRCSREFELAGGAISSAAITAAYLAAEAGHPVGMAEVLAGARREYRKMGRLLPGEWT